MKHLHLSAMCVGIVAIMVFTVPSSAASRQNTSVIKQAASPVFAFPANGTSYPASGPYLFQVQPVNGATGYLWSFAQNGMIVYQNLAWDGHLSPASYTISTNSKAHHLIHSGDLHVWVRAQMKDGTWSGTGAVLVRIQGSASSGASPQHKGTSGPPAPGTVLYQASTAPSFSGWGGTQDWQHLNGMLVNDGSSSSGSWIAPPYQVGSTNDYAVAAEIQVVKVPSQGDSGAFGIALRHGSKGLYTGEVAWNYSTTIYAQIVASPGGTLVSQKFDPGTDWHIYRVEVRGNNIRFLIDGSPILATTDNRYLTGGVGLYSNGVQLTVRNFKVIAL